jgi:hypothetical protein
MDLRHVCHLVAEALNRAGEALLAENEEAVHARVVLWGERSGVVVLAVERREYVLTVCERNARPQAAGAVPISEEAAGKTTGYTKARLPGPFRHAGLTVDDLEFAVGRQFRDATVVHVRGVLDGAVPFAGCVVVSEGRAAPAHDLRTFGAPRDLGELAVAVDLILASSPVAGDEIRRICD